MRYCDLRKGDVICHHAWILVMLTDPYEEDCFKKIGWFRLPCGDLSWFYSVDHEIPSSYTVVRFAS